MNLSLASLVRRGLGLEPPSSPVQDKTPIGQPIATSIQSYINSGTDAGILVTPQNALEAPTVNACVRMIAPLVARMEVQVLDRKGSSATPMVDSPLYRLLNWEPNEMMSSITFRESMLTDALLCDNAFAYIHRDVGGEPLSLEKLRPDLMFLLRDAKNRPAYQYLAPTGERRLFDGYDIFHLRGAGFDGLLGAPTIHFLRNLIAMELELERFVARFFRNGARPSIYIKLPGRLDEPALQRFREEIERIHTSPVNAGRVLVLEEGADAKGISTANDDAQLIDLRKFCRQQIAAAFGVPPHRVGDSEASGYNTTEQADTEFVKNTLATWAARFDQEAMRKLVRRASSIVVQTSFDALLRGDQKARFEAYRIGLESQMLVPDECRKAEGMPPRPDGGGAAPIARISSPSSEAKPAAPEEPEEPEEEPEDEEDEAETGESEETEEAEGEEEARSFVAREAVEAALRVSGREQVRRMLTRESKRVAAASRGARLADWRPDARMMADDLRPFIRAALIVRGREERAEEQVSRAVEVHSLRLRKAIASSGASAAASWADCADEIVGRELEAAAAAG